MAPSDRGIHSVYMTGTSQFRVSLRGWKTEIVLIFLVPEVKLLEGVGVGYCELGTAQCYRRRRRREKRKKGKGRGREGRRGTELSRP